MNEITLQEKLAALEAILFIHGEPLALKKLEALLVLSGGEVEVLIGEFEKRLSGEERGLTIICNREKIQLVTKPRFSDIVQHFIKEELTEDLSPASLETLSLIAYLGPVSRSRIEYFRGVNSLFTLRSLRIRGLVDRVADSERANGFLYQPSFEFLKHLGATAQTELPEYEKFHTLLTRSEAPLASSE